MTHCTLKSVFEDHSLDCYQKFIDDQKEFDSAGDLVGAYMKLYMREAKVELEVLEEVDIKFQAMINADITMGLW